MKRIVFIALAFFAGLSVHAQFTKATLQATGLTCAMCSNAINKALLEVPFVESVKSDIKNSSFDIVLKAGAEAEIDAIRKAVEDAGFSIGNLKMTGTFKDVEVKNDQHVEIGKNVFHFIGINDQSLSGEKTLMVVDRNFLTPKQYKKFSSASKMNCVKTGKAEACCIREGIPATARVYHVTI